jgi:serine protease Do
MGLYDLPKFNLPKITKPKFLDDRNFHFLILVILFSSIFGFLAGAISGHYFYSGEINDYLSKLNTAFFKPQAKVEMEYVPQTTQEESVIKAVKDFSPAVVSIVITKDVPIMEEYYVNPFQQFEQFFGQPLQLQIPQYRQNGTTTEEIGGGTGFIISEDGMILTNRHVVVDTGADYTVFTNDGKSYPAKVLARDSIQDLAIIKIEQEKTIGSKGEFSLKKFPVVKLGDSDKVQMGQTAIAIGNALGEFRNTVSVGVVSGLSRTIIASGGGMSETIEDVIQTDTAINKGNSGGPLLNLKGEVIGINTAMVEEAQSIGFAIPINKAKKDIEQIKSTGKIVYPFLGVRYILITEKIQKEKNLAVNYGALITKGENNEAAVSPGSAAEKAGLQENDIILEFNGGKITTDNSLGKIIQKYNPEDKISLKILRGKEEKTIEVVLGEKSE